MKVELWKILLAEIAPILIVLLAISIHYLLKSKPKYVITTLNKGVKMYYQENRLSWTPMWEGATHYKKKPKLYWVDNKMFKIETL
jgi:hypothetical protein